MERKEEVKCYQLADWQTLEEKTNCFVTTKSTTNANCVFGKQQKQYLNKANKRHEVTVDLRFIECHDNGNRGQERKHQRRVCTWMQVPHP